jgi:hypothetical protein
MGLHLELLAWSIVELVSKKTMSAPHVTNGRDKNVQQDRRKGLTNRQFCVTFKKLFCREIHLSLNFILAKQKKRESLTDKLFKSALST